MARFPSQLQFFFFMKRRVPRVFSPENFPAFFLAIVCAYGVETSPYSSIVLCKYVASQQTGRFVKNAIDVHFS